MVTGAGGSIGRELARQIARFGPSLLVLYERAEFALFDADRELRELWPDLPIAPVVGDVTDPRRLAEVFASTRPEVVFHAAAHKHVPLMEENPGEAVKNNVFGTYLLGRAAIAAGTEALILISTDKAVRPTSVMGATKRVAELVCQTLAAQGPTRFVAVRFGNVLGSAGSVVQIFRDQIARGGPVRVTHPEMKRYFMMIPEAAQLVLQAATMGEDGDVLVLDMGEPVRIVDLARKMIDLSGMEPGKDVEIVFTGLRPGEKLFEELALEGEGHAPTSHPKIHRGHLTPYPPDQIAAALRALGPLAESGDGDGIRRCLQGLLPEARLGLERSAHPGGEKAELHPAAAPSY
jgi:FlaA1/EpsC-like NDP-sugar epimerase